MLQSLAFLPPYAVVLLFFVFHLLAGAVMPYRNGYRPLLPLVMEKSARAYEYRLNRSDRGDSALVMRGVVVTILLALAAAVIAASAWRLTRHEFGWTAGFVLLIFSASIMGPLKTLRRTAGLLDKKETGGAAAALQCYFDEDLAKADSHTLVRRGLEFSGYALDRYFVGPVFYYLVGGVFALSFYAAFLALFDAFGFTRHFGRTARQLEAVLDFIPARLSAIIIAFAALFVSRSSPAKSLRLSLSQSSRFSPRNQGWLVAATAGALGVTLGGPVRHRNDTVTENGWIGDAGSTARLDANDLKRGTMLLFTAFLCIIVLVSAVVIALRH